MFGMQERTGGRNGTRKEMEQNSFSRQIMSLEKDYGRSMVWLTRQFEHEFNERVIEWWEKVKRKLES